MGAFAEKPGFWIVMIVLLLLLFGAKRLPDLSRSVGRSLRIFKAETDGLKSDGEATAAADVPTPPAAVAATPVAASAPPVATPAPAAEARYLMDPVTGERVLATPVQQPQQP